MSKSSIIAASITCIIMIAYGGFMFFAGYQKAMDDKEEYSQARFVEIFLWAVQTDLISINTNRVRNPVIMEDLRQERLEDMATTNTNYTSQ